MHGSNVWIDLGRWGRYREYNMRKILLQDGEFVLTENSKGEHLVYHCHCDECGGSRNGPPYWASCDERRALGTKALMCRDCPALVPEAMSGMVNLIEWHPSGRTKPGKL